MNPYLQAIGWACFATLGTLVLCFAVEKIGDWLDAMSEERQ